jgi:hypothetical protein
MDNKTAGIPATPGKSNSTDAKTTGTLIQQGPSQSTFAETTAKAGTHATLGMPATARTTQY